MIALLSLFINFPGQLAGVRVPSQSSVKRAEVFHSADLQQNLLHTIEYRFVFRSCSDCQPLHKNFVIAPLGELKSLI